MQGFKRSVLKKIRNLHESGHTIVLITHDVGSVRVMCQRCIVIDHHEKIYDGPVDQGADQYLKVVQEKGE